jgi:hypothetical protein
MEERTYFRVNKQWEDSIPIEGYIEENQVFICEDLIWSIDEDNFEQSNKQQLESLLTLHWYDLQEILDPDEVFKF